MSLEDLYKEDRLKKHKTSAREIGDLLRIVDRDLPIVKAFGQLG
jgi:hypothetical protein